MPIGTDQPPIPTSESQLRSLFKLEPDQRADAWKKAVARSNGAPTGKTVSEVVSEMKAAPPSDHDEITKQKLLVEIKRTVVRGVEVLSVDGLQKYLEFLDFYRQQWLEASAVDERAGA